MQANGSSGAPPARGGPAPPKHQQRKLSRKVAFLESEFGAISWPLHPLPAKRPR